MSSPAGRVSDQRLDLLGPDGAARAEALEAADDVPSRRDRFVVPDGVTYLAGNSLGLQPRAARAGVEDVLRAWATAAVAAHVEGADAQTIPARAGIPFDETTFL